MKLSGVSVFFLDYEKKKKKRTTTSANSFDCNFFHVF